MKKAILMLVMSLMLLSFKSYGAELTQSQNGVDGEISVKYDNQISPLVLVEGKIMGLTVNIVKTVSLTNPKMFLALYNGSILQDVVIQDGTDTGTQYNFESSIELPSDLTGYTLRIFLWEQDMKPVSNRLQLITVLKPIIYTYNHKNQIVTIEMADKVITYNYDSTGNLLNKTTAVVQVNSLSQKTLLNEPFSMKNQKNINQRQFSPLLPYQIGRAHV